MGGADFADHDVTGIFDDARRVIKDSMFVAIRGTRADGHDFLANAITRGAKILVVEDTSKVPANFPGLVFKVQDARETLDILAARWVSEPGAELCCVGVTGTNGKTSTTYMIESILNDGGFRTGVIGTVDHHLGARVWPTAMTTPGPLDLQQRLRDFRDAGATALAMEVSSHALDQRRADSVPFNAVVFTNLTRDHLDYHKSMQEYFNSKQRLFTDLLWRTTKSPAFAIVNVGDSWGRRLRVADPARLWTYGDNQADFRFKIIAREFNRTHFKAFTPAGETEVNLPMGGDHNVQNAIAAMAVGLSAGLKLAQVTEALNRFPGVPGRMQSVPNKMNLNVIVDYAHTPDALEKVLHVLKEVRSASHSQGKIWALFGCGGNRDRGKRPEMFRAAFENSDQVVVTSDNPRNEEPQSIVDDILSGADPMQKNKVHVELDRKNAINHAVSMAKPGDVILIAGKGHENKQIIGDLSLPFDDFQVASEIVKNLERA